MPTSDLPRHLAIALAFGLELDDRGPHGDMHRRAPRRIRIEIEMVVSKTRQQSPRGYRFGTLTLWLLVAMLALALLGS